MTTPTDRLHAFVMRVHGLKIRNPDLPGLGDAHGAVSDVNSILNTTRQDDVRALIRAPKPRVPRPRKRKAKP